MSGHRKERVKGWSMISCVITEYHTSGIKGPEEYMMGQRTVTKWNDQIIQLLNSVSWIIKYYCCHWFNTFLIGPEKFKNLIDWDSLLSERNFWWPSGHPVSREGEWLLIRLQPNAPYKFERIFFFFLKGSWMIFFRISIVSCHILKSVAVFHS